MAYVDERRERERVRDRSARLGAFLGFGYRTGWYDGSKGLLGGFRVLSVCTLQLCVWWRLCPIKGVGTGFCRKHTQSSNSLRAFATRLSFMALNSLYLGAYHIAVWPAGGWPIESGTTQRVAPVACTHTNRTKKGSCDCVSWCCRVLCQAFAPPVFGGAFGLGASGNPLSALLLGCTLGLLALLRLRGLWRMGNVVTLPCMTCQRTLKNASAGVLCMSHVWHNSWLIVSLCATMTFEGHSLQGTVDAVSAL